MKLENSQKILPKSRTKRSTHDNKETLWKLEFYESDIQGKEEKRRTEKAVEHEPSQIHLSRNFLLTKRCRPVVSGAI